MTDDDTPDVWAPGGEMSRAEPARSGGAPSDAHRPTESAHAVEPQGSRRRWPFVVGGGVVVAGLTVGVLVLSSSSGDAPTTDAVPETSDAPSTSTTGPRSAPPPTAGTNPGRGSSTVAELSSDLPVVDLRAVVFGADGIVHEIDLAERTRRSTPAAPVQSGAPAYAFVDDGDEIVVVAYDNVPGFRLDADRNMEVIDASEQPGGLLWPGPFANTAWQLNRAREPGEAIASLVGLSGEELGIEVDVDGSFAGGDGRGGVVVEAAGGFYDAGTGPPSLITGGDLLAIGAGHALAFECDAELTCGHVTIDRVTGDRVEVPSDAVAVLPPGSSLLPRSLLAGGVSPDGEVAVVRLDDQTRHRFVDLGSGTSTDVDFELLPMPVVWSADGSVALFAANSGVQIFQRDTGEILSVPDIGRAKAIVTPASAGLALANGSLFETGTAFENGSTIEAELLVGGAGN